MTRCVGHRFWSFITSTAALGALTIVLAVTLISTILLRPSFEEVIVESGEEAYTSTIPAYAVGEQTRFVVRAVMQLPIAYVTRYRLIPDDCLDSLTVNGIPVDLGGSFCDWRYGRVIDLSAHLTPGRNHLELSLWNIKGQGSIEILPSESDPLVCSLRGLLVLCLLLGGAGAARRIWGSSPSFPYALLFVAGVVLQVIYFWSMPYWVRAYDWGGHVEYVHQVRHNWTIPDPKSGWQAYQPPLYYFLSAALVSALHTAGLAYPLLRDNLQLFALFTSVAAQGFMLWTLSMLFGERRKSPPALLAGALAVILPGTLMFSARISNDVLCYLLTAASFAFAVRFWIHQCTRDIALSAGALGLSLITKSNAIALLPLVAFVAVGARGLPWARRLRLLALSGLIVFLLSGWFYGYRFLYQSQEDLVGNIDRNPAGLRVENTFATLTVFNPFKVLEIPFNHTWRDSHRRSYFWEFFYRSIFFGEFDFGKERQLFASTILLAGMVVFGAALFAMGRALFDRQYEALPVAILLLLLTGALFAVRVRHNISGFADFRYVPLVTLGLSYFTGLALERAGRIQGPVLRHSVVVLISLCVVLIFALYPL